MLLKVSGLTKRFGDLIAVDNVEFDIGEGEIVGLIGPNGAGKTTLFNCLMGLHKPDEGEAIFDEKFDLMKMKPHQICKAGIARTFQEVRTFLNLSVLDNLKASSTFGRETENRRRDDEPHQLLESVGLGEKKDALAKNLNIGNRRLLELAMALSTHPRIILVDEIASGLSLSEISSLTDTIEEIRNSHGISIFWIEHVMSAIMESTDRVIVLDNGSIIAEGKPEEIKKSKKVTEVYLGTEYD
ncbi:ABC transporter [candidate division MSBL1 archaeon SCGC-AAA259M10]|uniref:ABC transporter n=1 Tax=candidate division MSBL1 archaeon SCGC-AAA259M10 TaxID=1698270 RepID=A0A133UYL3_9EURY|nr:ABC transporter [candidate division MSBL1 archaeon SCGC-AAA259M10]